LKQFFRKMSRPELTGLPSDFYNASESGKYAQSSRMNSIQNEITNRALELLALPEGSHYILDIGCGTGMSGAVLESAGHYWVGCDVSRSMLDEAVEAKGDGAGGGGDLLEHDMGTGLPFQPQTFDSCVSISALQWLCYSNSKDQFPKQRLLRFFSSLYLVLKRTGRAVLQFYPETAEQAVLISECASRVGFSGGVVVDYPNSTKAKKHYLVLGFDRGKTQQMPAALGTSTSQRAMGGSGVSVATNAKEKRAHAHKKKKGSAKNKTRDWVLQKKEVQRRKGEKNVREDTKFTARKRKDKF